MSKQLSGDGTTYSLRAHGSLFQELNLRDTAEEIAVHIDRAGSGEEAHYYMEFPGDDSNLQLWFGTEEETREVLEAIEKVLD